jgi:hypothetical protein
MRILKIKFLFSQNCPLAATTIRENAIHWHLSHYLGGGDAETGCSPFLSMAVTVAERSPMLPLLMSIVPNSSRYTAAATLMLLHDKSECRTLISKQQLPPVEHV